MDSTTLLNERYQDFLRTEKTLLWDIHKCILKTGPDDTDLAHLQETIAQLDELFLLVVVGEFNSGKSAFINTFLGQKILEEGPTPTTDRITILKYGEESISRVVDNLRITRFPLDLLKAINIVDTPGTNSIIKGHDELTVNFIPKADFVVFVLSVDRPLTESEREFLELIGLRWKRKVVFLLNKIDTKDEQDLQIIIQYLEREGKNILEMVPVIFPVSVKWAFEGKSTDNAALLQKSRFPAVETYLLTALTEEERIRLKLLNPLRAVQPICEKVINALQRELALVKEDLQNLQVIQKGFAADEMRLKEDYPRFLLKIQTILFDLRSRADDFIEDFVQIHNVWHLRAKDKIEHQFNEHVVKNASQQIEDVLREASAWMAQKTNDSWKNAIEHYNQQIYQNERQKQTLGEIGGRFINDRESMYDRVIRDARTKLQAFDFQEESRNILKTFQKAVLQFGVTEMGALGIGAVLLIIFETFLFDITGILASGALVTAGLFVLPRKRRQAKTAFHAKIQELFGELERSISQQFDEYLHASFDQIRDIFSPHDRFCHDKHAELEAAQAELIGLIQRLSALQRDIQQQLAE